VQLNKTLASVDWLLDGSVEDQEEAYQKLKKLENEFPDNSEYLWRYAKATRLYAIYLGSVGYDDRKKILTFKSFDIASSALELDAGKSEVHKWYAITLGSKGEYLSVKEKIADGFTFKQHLDKALELSPRDPTIHHLLGRFCYEVAALSWFERKVAATLFSSPPSATNADAIAHFEQAEQHYPGQWKENKLYLAKSYIAEGEYAKAVKWLDEATQLPSTSLADEESQKEIEELLYKYSGYRS